MEWATNGDVWIARTPRELRLPSIARLEALPKDYIILQRPPICSRIGRVVPTFGSASGSSDEGLQHSEMIYGLLENRKSCGMVMGYTGDGLRMEWATNGMGYEWNIGKKPSSRRA
jgi:hypothetical protein